MAERFGGDEAKWLRAHDAAWAEYVREAESIDWSARPWVATVEDLDSRHVVQILGRMAVPWRPPDSVAFSREVEDQVMSSINVRFSDARGAMGRLRKASHKVYVATSGTEASARGALRGAGLLDAFDGIFTGHTQGNHKSQRAYWTRILENIRADAAECLLVDDRLEYLEPAAAVGFTSCFLDRRGRYPPETVPRFVRATLRNLAGLPHYVEVLSHPESR